jgi:hypothetical protein
MHLPAAAALPLTPRFPVEASHFRGDLFNFAKLNGKANHTSN